MIGKNIDTAMLLLDQTKILQALDALVTLTEFVQIESVKSKDQESYLPSSEERSDAKKVF